MVTMFLEIGIFMMALVSIVFFQMQEERKKYRDCQLFCRILQAAMGILVVDTVGWIIDGNPIYRQIWFTTLMDGLDLLLTTVVCWTWVNYALYIVKGDTSKNKKWYEYIPTLLLMIQFLLVGSSQIFNFYFYVDASGVYHRGRGYILHSLISLLLLGYSSGACLLAYFREAKEELKKERKKELLFVAFITIIPIVGNVVQVRIYGYPTVWLCMVFMILTVYIHIQNKRIHEERKAQNDVLKRALEQAQAANLAKSDFLSRVSHDIRTPMNTIMNLTKMVASELDDKEAAISDLRKIETSNMFLLSLVNDILDMSRIEQKRFKLQKEAYSYEEFYNYIHSTFEPLCKEKNIEFTIEQGCNRVDILTDKVRFNQLCFNLLSNAIKYTPAQGHVHFKMQHGEIVDGKYDCDLYIIDDGIGMGEEFQQKLFEPFAQEGRAFETVEGTGLGLSIVKEIVDLFGATIEVLSEENKGTTVHVHMELVVAETSGQILEKKEANIENLKGCHALIVEDHLLNQEIAKRLLEKVGMQVTICNNGKEAIDEFAKNTDVLDAILMDIRMPVMDGLEATKRIRQLELENAKTIPIIAMTANAFYDDEWQTMAAGMNAHLAKPIEPHKLYETLVEQILKKRDQDEKS